MNFLDSYKYVGTYSDMIQCVVKLTNCKKYLELGVAYGDNISMIKNFVDMCVAVDIQDLIVDKKKIDFYLMRTDQFFEQNTNFFDIIFIDGDHKWTTVRRDFENSLKILNEFGIIILHDTDPIVIELLSENYCVDPHLIHDYIYSNHPELNIITFPICDMGLTFVMRKSDRRVLKLF